MRAHGTPQLPAQAWHPSNKSSSSTDYVAGTTLGFEDTAVDKQTWGLPPGGLSPVGGTENNNLKNDIVQPKHIPLLFVNRTLIELGKDKINT